MSEEDLKEREEFRTKLNQLWKCVLGNGHPEEGIAWKVKELADFTATVKRILWIGVAGAVSAILLFAFQLMKLLISKGLL